MTRATVSVEKSLESKGYYYYEGYDIDRDACEAAAKDMRNQGYYARPMEYTTNIRGLHTFALWIKDKETARDSDETSAESKEEITEEAPAEDQPEEAEEETHTTGYDSYVSQFPQKPEYTKEIIPQFGGKPFNAWVREHGGDPDKAVRGTKLLDSIGTSETIPTAGGGYIEAMWDDSAGVIVALLIPPDQAETYRRYQAPLPLWAY